MLKISIPPGEFWDSQKEEFIKIGGQDIQLEHSLVSISKWEAKWCKPFLAKNDKSSEEILDYIKCMTLTQNVKDETYLALSAENYKEINEYIDAPMTATWFSDNNSQSKNKETITSELIYYWMIALNIPFECQKWHLNRLLTLINVCNIKNAPAKKMSKREIMSRNKALNAARRKANHTSG